MKHLTKCHYCGEQPGKPHKADCPAAHKEKTTRTIGRFQVVDHGIDNSQYFRGCGVCPTEFSDVATGIGNNPAEAVDDALESLAQMDWETEGMEKRILAQEFPRRRAIPKMPRVPADGDEIHYFVSIRVRELRCPYCLTDCLSADTTVNGLRPARKGEGCEFCNPN